MQFAKDLLRDLGLLGCRGPAKVVKLFFFFFCQLMKGVVWDADEKRETHTEMPNQS